MKSILLSLILSVFLCTASVGSVTDPNVPDIFFPFGPDQGDSTVPVADDVSSPAVNIATGFPFLLGNYSTVFVSIKDLFCNLFTFLLSYACSLCISYCTFRQQCLTNK